MKEEERSHSYHIFLEKEKKDIRKGFDQSSSTYLRKEKRYGE